MIEDQLDPESPSLAGGRIERDEQRHPPLEPADPSRWRAGVSVGPCPTLGDSEILDERTVRARRLSAARDERQRQAALERERRGPVAKDAPPGAPKLIAYCRASTNDQELSIKQQRAALVRHAEYAGIQLVAYVEEVASAGSLRRSKFQSVLRSIRLGSADGFIVTRLDRMTRSVSDASKLFGMARAEGFSIVMLDPAIDTGTPYGMAFAQVAAVFAELERSLISQRTREALAERRAAGVVLGRPPEMHESLDERIYLDREAGLNWQEIARMLEADGILPPQGGTAWHHSTLTRAYRRFVRKIQ